MGKKEEKEEERKTRGSGKIQKERRDEVGEGEGERGGTASCPPRQSACFPKLQSNWFS